MKTLLVKDDRNPAKTVDVCHDGEEGLLFALDARRGYNLVMLDRMLPVVDGLTILKAIRAKGLQPPSLLITGLAEVEYRITGLDAGADDYLVKPFAIMVVTARVLVKKALAPARQSLQSQKEFIAAASHELKAPLALMQINNEEARRLAQGNAQVPPAGGIAGGGPADGGAGKRKLWQGMAAALP